MDSLTLDVLVDLESRGWDALCSSAGDEFYGQVMTEDGLMVLVDGSVMDRDDVVASLGRAPAWDRYELTDPRIVAMGADSAALVYQARAWRGDEPPFEAVMTSSYVLVDGEPRLAVYQQTSTSR